MKTVFSRFPTVAAATVTTIAVAVFLLPQAASAKFIEYVYDGNGNVTELLDGNTGEIVGSYAYTPFGKTTKIEGAAAEANKIRFSTKYQDQETGLSYYGYRYYNPTTGRWLNRDPIGEFGGVNLYAFVWNRPTNSIDYLGMYFPGQEFEPIFGPIRDFFTKPKPPEPKRISNSEQARRCIAAIRAYLLCVATCEAEVFLGEAVTSAALQKAEQELGKVAARNAGKYAKAGNAGKFLVKKAGVAGAVITGYQALECVVDCAFE